MVPKTGIVSAWLLGFALLLLHWKRAVFLTGLGFHRWRLGQSLAPNELCSDLCQLANLTVWNIRWGKKAQRYWFCSCRVPACRCFCQEKWLKLGFLRYFNPIWIKLHRNVPWYCLHGPRSTLFLTVVFARSHCNGTSLLKSPFSMIPCELAVLIKYQTLPVAGWWCAVVRALLLVWLKGWEYFVASSFEQVWKAKRGLP